MRFAARIGWCGPLIVAVCGWAEVRFAGEVRSPNRAPLAGVRVSLKLGSRPPVHAFSNPQGRFVFELAEAGSYLLDAERDGYYPVRAERISVEEGHPELSLTLEPVREQLESVEVREAISVIDMDTVSSQNRVTSRDLVNVPYPHTNDLRGALRVAPGVMRDSRGGLHVNGASEDQVLYTLNGFTVNDPLTGKFESRVSLESVQNVEVSSGNLPAEFGKGSGGVLAVQTQTGGDRLRYNATNFFPGFENRKGWTFSDWTPRLGLSGPLIPGRTWFSESFDFQYNKTIVRELPVGQDRTSATRLSNLLHVHHNLRPSHILSGGVLMNGTNAARTGLSAIDPIETTVDRRNRQWFFYGRDQMYLRRRMLIEIGFASGRTFAREIPQGPSLTQFTVWGRRGNSFVDGIRKAGRDQALINVFLPSFTLAGGHLLKVGIDLDRIFYRQDVRRTGFEDFNEAGLRTIRTMFRGNGAFGKSNYETSSYVQDAWRIRPDLLLEGGVRLDWDALLRTWTPSPRLGAAWSPGTAAGTKLYGGVARIADATNVRLFSRPLDQYTLTTYFDSEGQVGRGPALSIFTIRNRDLLRPYYLNLFAGGAHRWQCGIILRADYSRRRGSRGFTYRNTVRDASEPLQSLYAYTGAQVADSIYDLTNERTDSFDSGTVSVRQAFGSQYEWFAAYTRSRARSNTVVDVSVEDPVTVTNNVGPMPWDAPNRFQSWGYVPSPLKNWAIAYLVEARTGFPFSVHNDAGAVLGAVNSQRFPTFFELNLHVERRFTFRGHRWAWRMGSNNATNRINPDTVNRVAGSSRFMQFYGGNGRTLNFRVRWLGRAAN